MKNGKCPKCLSQNILTIKDAFHSNGAGNISKAKHFYSTTNTAIMTFYVCKTCGYVESYLDKEEINKLID